jgi:hypothetical protein
VRVAAEKGQISDSQLTHGIAGLTAELIQVMSAAARARALCHSAPLIRIRGTLARHRRRHRRSRGNAISRALISSQAGIKASYAHYSFVARARVSDAEHVRPRHPISAAAAAAATAAAL